MMPIMTAGLSSLPTSRTSSGSAFNNLTQRVTSALGLALITGIATSEQAQFMADRSGLLKPDGADMNPQLAQMAARGPGGLLPLWQQLGVEVQAQAYSNVFMITGCTTFLGVALAFCLRNGKPSTTQPPIAGTRSASRCDGVVLNNRPNPDTTYEDSSIRRTTTQQYMDAVDWTSAGHVARVLRVFERLMDEFEAQHTERLRRLLRRDGYEVKESGEIIALGPQLSVGSLANLKDPAAIIEQLDRIGRAIQDDPPLAAGSAKEGRQRGPAGAGQQRA
jgi:hypothetical protein